MKIFCRPNITNFGMVFASKVNAFEENAIFLFLVYIKFARLSKIEKAYHTKTIQKT